MTIAPRRGWLKKHRMILLSYSEAIALMRDILSKKDNLGMEMGDWIEFGDDVVARLCDAFNISEKELYEK